MITKLKKMNEYPTAKHRMTLHPEWDVLYALHHTLESFPKRPTIEWVESHQDDHKANRNLSFGAKLNIQADKLATIGLQSLKCKPRVPMAPSSCVQIHMNGTTITREFRKEVRLRVHKQKLSEYYCARFRWSSRLITRIDWSIFGPAYIRRTKKKFVWTHKFHNRKLPTGERMKNRGGLEDERCCSCGALLETDDHLFQCPKRPQFHRRLLTVVGEMQTILDPTLYYILYDGIYNFITDSNEEKLNLPPTQKKRSPCISSDSETDDDESDDRSVAAKKEKPPSRRKRKRQATDTEKTRDLYLLKREQANLGWDNLLRGKFSKGWRTLQRRYELRKKYERNERRVRLKRDCGKHAINPYDADSNRNEKKKKDAFQGLIEKIFNVCEDEMWKQRNLDRHKPNNGSNYSAIIKVDREIRCLYGYRDEVCTDDSPIFYKTEIDTLLAQTLKTKQQWITRWKPAILSSRKRATRDATRNTKPIYKFFGGKKPRTTINAAHIR